MAIVSVRKFFLLRRIRGPLSLPSVYRVSYPKTENGRGVKLTAYIRVVRRIKIQGAVPPLPHTSSWRGA
jgi:hypothetical protein